MLQEGYFEKVELITNRSIGTTVGCRAFPVAGLRVWNCQPPEVTSAVGTVSRDFPHSTRDVSVY